MRQGDDYLLTNIIDHVANVGRHQREDVVKQSLVASQLGRSDIQILRGPVTCQVDIPEKKSHTGPGGKASILSFLPAFTITIVTYRASM